MARPPAPPPPTATIVELAAQVGLTPAAAERLFESAGHRPAVPARPGRGNLTRWHEADVHLLRALKQLSRMGCPVVWRVQVVRWWRTAELGAVAGRHLVVCPSREHSPVFVTSTANVGRLLAGCHAWVVDLASEIVYR